MVSLASEYPVATFSIVAVVGWILWKIFQNYLVRSPLDNVPGPARTSFWKGNVHDIFNRHAWDFHKRLAEQYGPVVKFHGALGAKGLYVYDPKALNHIVVKEQGVYDEPEWLLLSNELSFGPDLLSVHGESHRKQRKLLNPVFHINHMRHMSPIFYRTIHRLHDAVTKEVGATATDVNMLDWMGRTALELIGQGGLGYSFDPLTENKSNAYGDALKDFLPTLSPLQIWRPLLPLVVSYVPLAIRRALAPYVPIPTWGKLLSIIKAMDTQSKNIFYGKKQALEKGDEALKQQIGEGRDIMSILMKANMQASAEDRLPDEELLGQMSLLVFAATDTTSNSLTRVFDLLGQHPDVQAKLRAEILEASPDGEDIPYDTLVALPYLDAVCRETLRLHSPVSLIFREAHQDAVLPLSEPIIGNDGQIMSEIPIPKGTAILLGVDASNRNKALWGDDAMEWKPERWLSPLPDTLSKAHIPGVYSNLMTFNGGGRACLGFKFSQLEMKTVIAVMLRTFKFSPSDKEVYWNLAAVNYPTVGKVSNTPAAFFKLEPIKV